MAESPDPTPNLRPFVEFRPLLRGIGIASDGKKLILAALGLATLSLGWSAIARLFGDGDIPPIGALPIGLEADLVRVGPWVALRGAAWALTEPFRVVVTPFVSLFGRGAGAGAWFQSALMAVWAAAVWGIFGGAIARIAVVRAAADQGVGMLTAVRFALRKSSSLIGAPVTPFLAVGVFAAGSATFGLLYRIPGGVGSTIAAFLGFVPLILGLLMALVLVGLSMCWPLMHATVAAEGEDAPDALSRSYSYVNQRMIRYLVHMAASWGIGSIGLVVAFAFAMLVLALARWGVSLGAPESPTTNDLASTVAEFWPKLVEVLVHAWVYSYFWSASSIVYLILRRDVDGTPWHDVFQPEQLADTFAEAPVEPPV